MKTTRLLKYQSGIGLVEIMIASVIGMLLMGGLMQMFITSKQTYKLQDAMSKVQENGRFAMDFLLRDVRETDSWGCFSDRGTISDNSGTVVENLLNRDLTATPVDVFETFSTGIAGENDHISSGSGDLVRPATDTLSVISTSLLQDTSGKDLVITAIDSSPSGTDPLTISATDTSTLQTGDIVYLSDCDLGSVFQITSINNATGVVNHALCSTLPSSSCNPAPGNKDAELTKSYRVGSDLYKVSFARYEIRQGERGNPSLFDEPSLYRTINNGIARELVEGVENMQILYGEDTDSDSTANYYVPANQIVNMNNVVSLKISLVVQSLEDNLSDAPIAYNLNGVTITPTDRRIRRVFSYVIAIRNRLV